MTKKKNILEARSKKNGIVFYSDICPRYGAETYIDDLGIIHSIIIPVQLDELIDISEILAHNEKSRFSKFIPLVFDVILIIVCLILRNPWYIFASIYFSVTASFDLFHFIKSAYLKFSESDYRSRTKFHSAEHMVVNAYRKFQRIPTFREVKQSSRFSKYCGSRILYHNIVESILMSLIIVLSSKYGILFCYLGFIFINMFMSIVKRMGLLKFLQIFVTSPPSNVEIQIALEGIKAFEDMEEKLRQIIKSNIEDYF